MPDERASLLVLGLGNLLCGDDGLGVAAVHRLLDLYEPPSGAEVLDGGTLGLSLLPYLEAVRDVILVDAVRFEAPPGSPVRLEGSEVPPAARERLSTHQVGVADLLAGAHLLDRYPERLVLLGLVPETLELGLTRSPAVEANLAELVERVVEEARGWGYDFSPRSGHEATAVRSDGVLAAAGRL